MRNRAALLVLILLAALLVGIVSSQAIFTSRGTAEANSGYPIYRIEFGINTTANNATFDIGSSVYIYNLTAIPSIVGVSWTPTSFTFSRAGSQEILVQVVSFVYMPYGLGEANLTIVEDGGESNITVYNYNTGAPVLEQTLSDQKAGSFKTTLTNLNLLTNSGPVFTVHDSLRGQVQKSVLAYYYPWYSSSDWFGNGRNCTGCSSATGEPQMGFYSSQNTSIIDEQISLAKGAGINGFLVAWGSNDAFASQATTLVFQEASKLSFPVTIYYQSKSLLNLSMTQAQAKFVSDIEYILQTYGNSNEMLKIDGVPSLFIFNVDEYPVSFWSAAIAQVRASYPAFYMIGDSLNFSYFAAFDGLSDYNVNFNNILVNTKSGHTNGTLTSYYNVEIEADLYNKLWFAPAMTGFDNINDGLESPSFWPRQNGSTYELTWNLALNSYPDGVTVTSWNEWHEGTNIEPINTLVPTPDYWAYANQYLNLTASEVQAFEGTQGSSPATSMTTLPVLQTSSTDVTSSPGTQQTTSSANSSTAITNNQNSSQNSFLTSLIRLLGMQDDSGAYIASTFAGLTSFVIIAIGAVPLMIYGRKSR